MRRGAIALGLVCSGCALVAGLDEITYVEPAEAVAPTEPPIAEPPTPRPAPLDSGTPADAEPVEDAASDAADAGDDEPVEADAGPDFFGCSGALFDATDRTDPSAVRAVFFPAAPLADGGPAPAPLVPHYAPRCMRVAAGQIVTFYGPFATYALAPRRGAPSPIARTSTGAAASFTFSAPGRYGFTSPRRPTMRGVIEVVAP